MQAVSAAFLNAITGDHVVAVKAEFLSPTGQTITTINQVSNTLNTASVPSILDGSVTIDKKSEVRSRFSLKIVDPTFALVPVKGSDALTPYGNEVKISRGVQYLDGTQELVLLGIFRITDVDVEEQSGGLSVSVAGSDRSRSIVRNVLTSYYAPTPSTSYGQAIQDMLRNRDAKVVFNDSAANWAALQNDPSVLTPANWNLVFQEGSNLWTEARNMAMTVGCDLFFMREGIVKMLPDPNLVFHTAVVSPNPLAFYTEGATATFQNIKRHLSDSSTFNRVVITGEGNNFGLPLKSAPADDNDPHSFTNVNGYYGLVPYLETNSLIVTQVQADNYAALSLRTKIGAQELVEFPALVNPALDVDDCIQITRARVGINAINYIIDSMTIPLRADQPMQVRLRERRALL